MISVYDILKLYFTAHPNDVVVDRFGDRNYSWDGQRIVCVSKLTGKTYFVADLGLR